MMVLVWILIGLFALVLGGVAVLIATPLHVHLTGKAGDGENRLVLEARTLWGLSPAVRVVDTDRPRKAKTEKRKDRKPSRKAKKRRHRGPAITPERLRRAARGMPDLLAGEIARLHVDRLSLETRFGTGDPADTGRIYGWLTPLIYGIPRSSDALSIVPDFDRACLVANGEAAVHFTPVALGGPVIRLAWNVFVRPT